MTKLYQLLECCDTKARKMAERALVRKERLRKKIEIVSHNSERWICEKYLKLWKRDS